MCRVRRPAETPHGVESAASGEIPTMLIAADRQALPALGAAALEHEAAVFCTHTDQEPVSSPATAVVWLKCALSLHRVLRMGNSLVRELSIVANAF